MERILQLLIPTLLYSYNCVIINAMKQTPDHIKKRVESRMKNGNYTPSLSTRLKIAASRVGQRLGVDHHNWKGKEVGYFALHSWVRRNFEKPIGCEECGDQKSSQFNWAMVHGTFSRERTDWRYLCRRCHIIYDRIWANRERNRLGQFVPA